MTLFAANLNLIYAQRQASLTIRCKFSGRTRPKSESKTDRKRNVNRNIRCICKGAIRFNIDWSSGTTTLIHLADHSHPHMISDLQVSEETKDRIRLLHSVQVEPVKIVADIAKITQDTFDRSMTPRVRNDRGLGFSHSRRTSSTSLAMLQGNLIMISLRLCLNAGNPLQLSCSSLRSVSKHWCCRHLSGRSHTTADKVSYTDGTDLDPSHWSKNVHTKWRGALTDPMLMFFQKNPGDTMLIMQTERQAKIFANAQDVCLDATFKVKGCGEASHILSQVTRYNVGLVTIMVVDQYGRGRPVASIVTSSLEKVALLAAFSSIKSHTEQVIDGKMNTNFTLHTDDDTKEFEAFQMVFPKAVQALCIWHTNKR